MKIRITLRNTLNWMFVVAGSTLLGVHADSALVGVGIVLIATTLLEAISHSNRPIAIGLDISNLFGRGKKGTNSDVSQALNIAISDRKDNVN